MKKGNKGLRFSEDALTQMLKDNPHLNVAGIPKPETPAPIAKTGNHSFNKKVEDVCDRLQRCVPEWDFSTRHLRILFPDCRILNGNDLLTMAQQKPQPFRLMAYKKQCHNLMKRSLQGILTQCLEENRDVPALRCDDSESLRLSLFRQAKRLSDLDNMFLGFKYFTDGLHIPLQIAGLADFLVIEDDDMSHISEIIPYQVKGEYALGIMLEKIPRKEGVSSTQMFKSLEVNHAG